MSAKKVQSVSDMTIAKSESLFKIVRKIGQHMHKMNYCAKIYINMD